MPRFFFDFTSDGITTRDEVGLDFVCLEDAYLDACRAAREMGVEKFRRRQNPFNDAFEILDGERRPLMEVPFEEVVGNRHELRREGSRTAIWLNVERGKMLQRAVQLELQKIQSMLLIINAQLARAKRLAP